jgi:stalled ribosome rescue protein Dom34
MSTYHAIVWIDHEQAHVVMFDREHVEAERIHSRSHHSHQGKHADAASFFKEVSTKLQGTHEVLLTGPGAARTEFKHWCEHHAKGVANAIVDNVASDHPSDPQLVAMARQYFKKFDRMAANPGQV